MVNIGNVHHALWIKNLQELGLMCKSSSMLTIEKYNTVISGAGTAALACAWELINRGKRILIVNNRKMIFTRVQWVTLYPHSREYLLSMLQKNGVLRELKSPTDDEDIKFVLEILQKSTIAIKDIERFIKRRLDELNAHSNITFLGESQITSINLNTGVVKIRSSEEKSIEKQFLFDDVIGADGVMHHAANILNKDAKQQLISYSAIAQPTHRFHMSANVTIKRTDEEKLELPKTQAISSFRYGLWGMSLDIYAKSFVGKKIKSSFAGEIPVETYQSIKQYNKNLFDEKLKNQAEINAINFIQYCIQPYFDKAKLNRNTELKVELVKPSKKYEIEKNKLKLQAFKTDLYRANIGGVEVAGRRFILAGDAFSSPNYQFGNGVNHAFSHARKIGKINDGSMTLYQYTNECISLSASIENVTRLTNWCCFKRLALGRIEEYAIEKYRTDFLKRHDELLFKLRKF